MIRPEDEPRSRAERRERSRARILTAARELFAGEGYERTTIRKVAQAAGVDPALVMQHFESKEGLFSAAARSTVDLDPLVTATRDELPGIALEHVFAGFDDPERRASSLAMLRGSLTHPGARELIGQEVMGTTQAKVAETIGGDDAQLRAALLNACTLGLTIARYLLESPVLRDGSQEDIEQIMEPALRAIVTGR